MLAMKWLYMSVSIEQSMRAMCWCRRSMRSYLHVIFLPPSHYFPVWCPIIKINRKKEWKSEEYNMINKLGWLWFFINVIGHFQTLSRSLGSLFVSWARQAQSLFEWFGCLTCCETSVLNQQFICFILRFLLFDITLLQLSWNGISCQIRYTWRNTPWDY